MKQSCYQLELAGRSTGHRIAVSARAYRAIKATLRRAPSSISPNATPGAKYLLWLTEPEAKPGGATPTRGVVQQGGHSAREGGARLALKITLREFPLRGARSDNQSGVVGRLDRHNRIVPSPRDARVFATATDDLVHSGPRLTPRHRATD